MARNRRRQLGRLRMAPNERLLAVARLERWLASVRAERSRRLGAEGELAPGWLLPFRDELRRLTRKGNAWVLSDALDFARDDATRTLLVWLLSRRVSPRALHTIDHYADDLSSRVRRHAAKALRRAEAWSQLRRMAGAWPDDAWVQRYATEPRSEPHAERLARFAQRHIRAVAYEKAPPMALWARDRHWFLSPPKRADYLRRMLRRIQRWVRGRGRQVG